MEDAAFDVVVAGAGPVGLTLANLLGAQGVRTLVVESRATLIDYPRGVGMDDESLRAFQATGLIERVLPHTSPDQWIVFVDGRRRELAKFAATTRELGWPRRSGFIQPLVDQVLLDGLARYPQVAVRWATTLLGHEDDGTDAGVRVRLADADGAETSVRADWLVGADGGRSTVRKALPVAFEGTSSPTRWLVVDVADDPIGTPNSFVGCDPARPYVSSGLPHGIRRFEFMLFDGEGERDEDLADSARARALVRPFIDGVDVRFIRARVYTHHARVASAFRAGRVLLAGDAAHLMPPWQGQGYNTGIRDAWNLAWKLALVVRGRAHERLLDTYDAERRPHAAAMVRLSELTGRFLSPTDRRVAAVRDASVRLLGLVPPVRDYVLQMRFRPQPRYTAAVAPASGAAEAVLGALFPQPEVVRAPGAAPVLLDEALGGSLSVVQWGQDPRVALPAEALALLRGLGTRFVTVLPPTRHGSFAPDPAHGPAGEHEAVADVSGALRAWFNEHPTPMVFLRPDRVVAAACQPQHAAPTFDALAAALALTPAPVPAPAPAPEEAVR